MVTLLNVDEAAHKMYLTKNISVILSEFGAFSGGDGGTTIIEKVSAKYCT